MPSIDSPWGANQLPGEQEAKDSRKERPRTAGDNARAYSGPAEPLGMGMAARAQLESILKRHASTWTVEDTLLWVEHIGFRQYRRTFAHNQVAGDVLLDLTPEMLRTELRIDALGHRAKIATAIRALKGDKVAEKAAAKQVGGWVGG